MSTPTPNQSTRRCGHCGYEANPPDWRACLSCGDVRLGPLRLVSADTGRHLCVRIGTTVGGRLLRTFAGEAAHYAAAEQFRLDRDAARGVWTVCAAPGTPNTTRLNGSPLAVGVPTELPDGAVLSLPRDTLRLTVQYGEPDGGEAS